MKFKVIFIALLCTIAIGFIHNIVTDLQERPKSPEKVTLYLKEESRICTLSLKDYIVGRLFAECPEPLEPEAMKAAACAISSTALFRIEHGDKPVFGADLADFPDCYLTPELAKQEYGKEHAELLPLYEAAAEYGITHAMIYENEAIFAPMCRLSVGVTDKGGYPWLQSVTTERDSSSNEYLATCAFNAEQVRIALRFLCPEAKLNADYGSWFSEAQYLGSGTLQSIKFGGVEVSGAELAETLGLRSNALSVEFAEERFVFTTRGIGENLGMSLYTADKLALLGSTAEEILTHFYKDVKVEKI